MHAHEVVVRELRCMKELVELEKEQKQLHNTYISHKAEQIRIPLPRQKRPKTNFQLVSLGCF